MPIKFSLNEKHNTVCLNTRGNILKNTEDNISLLNFQFFIFNCNDGRLFFFFVWFSILQAKQGIEIAES